MLPDNLYLDLGTRMGFALPDGRSGTVDLSVSRFESHGMKFIKMRNWLATEHLRSNFSNVYYEEVRFGGIHVDAVHAYGGFLATLQTFCMDNNVEYSGVPVATVKKCIVGSGKASKDDVKAAVQRVYGKTVSYSDEADALAIRYAIEVAGFQR